MKRIVAVLVVLLGLTGCRETEEQLTQFMELRVKLLSCESYCFEMDVTADYGQELQSFSMSCSADPEEGVSFTVTKPGSIEGISGTLSNDGGKLTFDEEALAFELLAEGQVTPVSAPWILAKTLQGGYVTSCTMEGELLRVSIDDSYQEDALHLDVWLEDDLPVRADVLYRERRILSLEVKDFVIL